MTTETSSPGPNRAPNLRNVQFEPVDDYATCSFEQALKMAANHGTRCGFTTMKVLFGEHAVDGRKLNAIWPAGQSSARLIACNHPAIADPTDPRIVRTIGAYYLITNAS